MSAAEGASEASSAEQANERTDERVTQYYSLYSWLLSTIEQGEKKGGRRKVQACKTLVLTGSVSALIETGHSFPFILLRIVSLHLVGVLRTRVPSADHVQIPVE